MSFNEAKAQEIAKRLLPCDGECPPKWGRHSTMCPAYYREVVEDAIQYYCEEVCGEQDRTSDPDS